MNQNNPLFSNILNESLKKLTKGSGIVFLGTILGTSLFYFSRILIGRYFTPSQYGIFSLGVILVSFFTLISLLGLREGVSRQIAFYLGKRDFPKLKKIIFSAFQIVLFSSLVITLFLYFFSDFLSQKIFHNLLFSDFWKIFLISIPFFSLIFLFTSIVRGFGRLREIVYFPQLLRNGLFFFFLIGIIILGLSFKQVIMAFLLSLIITAILFLVYLRKKSFYLKEKLKPYFFGSIDKELLFFSLPLLGIGILDNLNSWLDTLLIGYFKSFQEVGIYNGALVFAKFIPLILPSVGFIYLPIITNLYSQNFKKEVKKIYLLSTKWLFFLAFPLFFLFFLFPQTILVKFLGPNYLEGALPLQILALGFLIHLLFGLNGMTLLAFGETKFLLVTSLLATALGIILYIWLIPLLGIIGAAIATAFIFSLSKLLRSGKLYFSYGIHPFKKNYLKPLFFLTFFSLIIYFFTKNIIISWWQLPFFFLFFFLLSFFLIFLTKSLEIEEKLMLAIIIRKIKREFSWLKTLLPKWKKKNLK
jgi:O-antigen/teichoic acid export membrane protein